MHGSPSDAGPDASGFYSMNKCSSLLEIFLWMGCWGCLGWHWMETLVMDLLLVGAVQCDIYGGMKTTLSSLLYLKYGFLKTFP
jgi:hypothetical protein